MSPPPRPTTVSRLDALLKQIADTAIAGRGDRPEPVWVGGPPRDHNHLNLARDTGRGGLPLPRWALHEWLAEAPPQCVWTAAAGAAAKLHPGAVFWVGRACWPWAAALPAGLRGRSVFVDAPRRDTAARTWAVDCLLRSPAAAAVVGDGRGLSTAASRRLQLAAEAGDALALLWCGDGKGGRALSAAHYRWRVTPRASGGTKPPSLRPRWRLQRLRSKDAWSGRHGPEHGSGPAVFDVEVCDAQGLVVVSDPVAGRSRAADTPPRRVCAGGRGAV